MTKKLSLAAFIIGATIVLWVGSTFIASNPLALIVTAMIALVYCIGFAELMRFQQATQSLSTSLNNTHNEVTDISNWLNQLHPSLQNPARLRIEGERIGLPGPILTPYLVGLLVMLGLLGTFVGMVDTLKGAVLAMQSSTELETVRAGLAAPIKGLSLAFGTSVAGVAASAILGLISTLSRRERVLAARMLDAKMNSCFREFSLNHNRQQTFTALQGLAGQFETMTINMADRLIENQDKFHESVAKVYVNLAESVDASLKESLAKSGQLAGESIKPIITDAMNNISNTFNTSSNNWLDEQKNNEKVRFEQLSNVIETSQQQASSQISNNAHVFSNEIKNLISTQDSAFEKNTRNIERMTQDLNQQWKNVSDKQLEQQQLNSSNFEENIKQLTQTQQSSFANISDDVASMVSNFNQQKQDEYTQNQASQEALSLSLNQQITTMHTSQQEALNTITHNFTDVANTVSEQWQQAGKQSSQQQQTMTENLAQAAEKIATQAQAGSEDLLAKMYNVLQSSEALVQSRTDNESTWLENHNQRMQALTDTLKTELNSLRDAEASRGHAAIERLADLETAVAKQLETLGSALEEPMTRLIETASETPKAAAEVIAQMRGEISKNIEKDNTMLEERQRIMSDLNTVSDALHQTSVSQKNAAEELVTNSASILEQVGSQFSENMQHQIGQLNTTVDHFSGSTVEMNSMGESFSLAIKLFNESNSLLIEKLSTIESTLEKSSLRSDEQMGYYLAQARELIDHSVLSQREIFEELRQIGSQNDLFEAEVG